MFWSCLDANEFQDPQFVSTQDNLEIISVLPQYRHVLCPHYYKHAMDFVKSVH